MKNTRLLISVLAFFGACVAPLQSAAQKFDVSPSVGFTDGIDRTAPDFVKASLLVMSPGDELYSCAGHSCIRLECPTFNLDYCFSYESESVKDKIFTFFMGKLKMGMFAIPTADYLKVGRESGRGVMQYTLNLPPDAKQRLWKIFDERVARGADLPYDYIVRGCAQSDFRLLNEALSPYRMEISSWPSAYYQTRREFLDDVISAYPWNRFFIHAISGTEIDKDVPNTSKVVIPRDLHEILRVARVNGKPLIDGEGVELLPVKTGGGNSVTTTISSPIVMSGVVVLLAVVNFFFKWVWIDWLFLTFQSLAGAFFTYLVAFSSLPATDWNWLIVPFNLLPLIFWKWRAKWALWFAAVLVLWEIGMIAYPHRLTDPAYLVLVAAYVLMYARLGWKWNCAAMERRTAEPVSGGPPSVAAAAKELTRSCADIFEQLRRANAEAAANKRGRV